MFPAQITVPPPPHFKLPVIHRLLHIDACFGEPLQMLRLQLGVHDVEGFFPAVKAVFDKRAKHPVLLVDAVEESANVTLPAERTPGKLHGTALRSHIYITSPYFDSPPDRRAMLLL